MKKERNNEEKQRKEKIYNEPKSKNKTKKTKVDHSTTRNRGTPRPMKEKKNFAN